jgi:hypothetical protein
VLDRHDIFCRKGGFQAIDFDHKTTGIAGHSRLSITAVRSEVIFHLLIQASPLRHLRPGSLLGLNHLLVAQTEKVRQLMGKMIFMLLQLSVDKNNPPDIFHYRIFFCD